MIRVTCPACQTKYRFDESQLGGKNRVTTRCKKCGGTIEIDASAEEPATGGTTPPAAAPVTARREADSTARVRRLRSDEAVGEDTMTGQRAADLLELPPDKKYSLAVLQGKASGQIFQIQKARTVLGRADCDIVLDDPECSRQHAALEILGARVVVNDLNSTNGTFVQGERIQSTEIENHNEFRIGEHVLMLIVTDRE